MSNRAQRRKQAKKTPRWCPPTVEDQLKAMMKNGLTQADLDREYDRGFKHGRLTATEPAVKTCYAAFCLAMKEVLGFGHARAKRVLERADAILLESLSSAETVDEVLRRVGLRINFNEPFDRIEELEETQ